MSIPTEIKIIDDALLLDEIRAIRAAGLRRPLWTVTKERLEHLEEEMHNRGLSLGALR